MKLFGHSRPVRDRNRASSTFGEIIGAKSAPVKVKAREALGHSYGPDHNKRLVLTAHAGDLLGLRPERTQRELFIAVKDLYAYLVRLAAGRAHLEKAREKKAARALRLAAQRQARAEKRLIRQ